MNTTNTQTATVSSPVVEPIQYQSDLHKVRLGCTLNGDGKWVTPIGYVLEEGIYPWFVFGQFGPEEWDGMDHDQWDDQEDEQEEAIQPQAPIQSKRSGFMNINLIPTFIGFITFAFFAAEVNLPCGLVMGLLAAGLTYSLFVAVESAMFERAMAIQEASRKLAYSAGTAPRRPLRGTDKGRVEVVFVEPEVDTTITAEEEVQCCSEVAPEFEEGACSPINYNIYFEDNGEHFVFTMDREEAIETAERMARLKWTRSPWYRVYGEGPSYATQRDHSIITIWNDDADSKIRYAGGVYAHRVELVRL